MSNTRWGWVPADSDWRNRDDDERRRREDEDRRRREGEH